MPYVDRDETGTIRGLYNVEQRPGQEYLDATHSDVVAYKTRPKPMLPLAVKLDAALADPTMPGTLKAVLQEWRKQF